MAGSNRRSFITSAAAAGAAALATGGARAQTVPQTESKKYTLGVFGIDMTFWGLWNNILYPGGSSSGTDVLNMIPTHVWDKDTKKAREWADKWGWEVVDSYDGMVGKVDAVANGCLYNVPWQHRIMRPYLEAGMPCYLSRPWSNTLRNLDTMLDLAARYNAPIIATATYEHYDEADTYARKLVSVGEIDNVQAQGSAGDRPHFHLPYMMLKILGYNVEQVSLMTNDPRKVQYMQATYVFGGGDNQKPFACAMQAGRQYVFKFEITGRNGVIGTMMPSTASSFARFFPQLLDIQRTITKREHYQPLDVVRKKFECIQAEYYSHYERSGSPVRIGTVPADWQIPAWRPGWYDGSEFGS